MQIEPSGADILCTDMHEAGNRCTELLNKTANALSDDVLSVMLLAVRRGNLEQSISIALSGLVFLYRMT